MHAHPSRLAPLGLSHLATSRRSVEPVVSTTGSQASQPVTRRRTRKILKLSSTRTAVVVTCARKGATAYRPLGHIVRRVVEGVAVALASTLLVTTVVSSPYPLGDAALTALRAPALGHANEYSLVPSVIGKSVTAAMAALKTAKLGTLVHAPSMTARVYRQSPVGGLRVLRGDIVSIWGAVPARP